MALIWSDLLGFNLSRGFQTHPGDRREFGRRGRFQASAEQRACSNNRAPCTVQRIPWRPALIGIPTEP